MTKASKRKKRKITVHTMQTIENMSRWEGDCLEWLGYTIDGIYPQVCHDGKMIMVRKLVMKLAGRELPAKTYLKPSCGNPMCIRLEHIKVVFSTNHMQAMARAVNANSPTRIAKLQKSAIHRRKLTDEQVNEIRMIDASSRAIAEKFGISKSTVTKIKSNRARRTVNASSNPFAGLMR